MCSRLVATSSFSLIVFAACGGALPEPSPVGPAGVIASGEADVMTESGVAPAQVQDRQVLFRAAMDVIVEDPTAAAAQAEDLVTSFEGYVERSRGGSDDEVEMSFRIPAPALGQVMDGIRPLGKVERETSSSADVTGRMIDLEARIQSLQSVRDRLRGYIDRATTVEEIISIERELTRVQTEIERLTGELQSMRSLVTMAELELRLDRRHTPGPLTAAGKGVVWFIEKLFVWN
jgi:hypothetical protein